MKKMFNSRRIKLFLVWLFFIFALITLKFFKHMTDDLLKNIISSTATVLGVLIGGYSIRESTANIGHKKDEQ